MGRHASVTVAEKGTACGLVVANMSRFHLAHIGIGREIAAIIRTGAGVDVNNRLLFLFVFVSFVKASALVVQGNLGHGGIKHLSRSGRCNRVSDGRRIGATVMEATLILRVAISGRIGIGLCVEAAVASLVCLHRVGVNRLALRRSSMRPGVFGVGEDWAADARLSDSLEIGGEKSLGIADFLYRG